MEKGIFDEISIEQIFKDNILLDLLDRGFHFDFTNEKHKQIVRTLKNYNKLYELFDKINNINDIVFIIINTTEELLPLLTYLININADKVKQILKHPYINKKHVNFIIDTLTLEQLENDKEILETGISKGYEFNEHTIELLENNKELLIQKLESFNDSDIQELLYFINHLSNKVLSDNLIVNLGVTKGYYFMSSTPEILRSNKDVLKKILAIAHSKGDYAVATTSINNCDPTILDEQILTIAQEKLDYTITVNSPIERINDLYKRHYDDYLKQLPKRYREKLKKLGEKLGCGLIYYERHNSIFDEKVIDVFGITTILKIYKYCSLVGNNINFYNLIKNNQLECFKYLFTLLSEQYDNFKNFDISLFVDYLKKYEVYGILCLDFISAYGLSEENKNILRTLLNHKYRGIEISSITDLKNLTAIIQKHNNQIIQSNSKLEIKNLICLLLCNMTLKEFDEMLYSLDADNLTKLLNQIDDSKIKLTLEKYSILINFLNNIRTCNNLDILKRICDKLNSFDYWKLETFRTSFMGLFDNIKYFYGIEANAKLTDINSLKPSNQIVVKDNQCKTSIGKTLPYIDIHHDCIFFQHVMNAYGRGGKISDFKNPRLIGKSIICLSLISNNELGIEREPIDVDHVTLLFDKVEPTSLVMMNYSDSSSSVELNNLTMTHAQFVRFNTIYDMLEHTKNTHYNEYNFYLENNNGSFMYPSAVKVTGEIPTQAEIDAAQYLGVPLVKIHRKENQIATNNKASQPNYSESQLDELRQWKVFFNNLEFEYPKILSKSIEK